MFKHLSALSRLFKEYEPDLRLIQGATIVYLVYIFGDASGSGFRSSWTEGISVGCNFGVWNEEGYGTSSNYREFCNFLETHEELGRKGNFQGKEIFLCTYNMVSDRISAKGSSKLEALFHLVLQLHCLIMRFKFKVRFIHVAVTRMISQGMDGLYRDDMYEGIMKR